MATADQIKSLTKAYVERNDEKFKVVVLQIAAHEAKLGHENLARELKQQIDKITPTLASVVRLTPQNPMLLTTFPNNSLSELIVSENISEKIKQILREYRNKSKLKSFGFANRRKILLEGKPGTGKTLTASIIASELSLPLYTIQMDKLVTKFMGETSAKLRQIFDTIQSTLGIYLFDEFDAIGADRSLDNEVGEMRRILSSFLQFLEQDSSESIIIAATNNSKLLDQALFRRFDDILHYTLPTKQEIIRLLNYKFNECEGIDNINLDSLVDYATGLSQAEIVKVCNDAIKTSILNDIPIKQNEIIKLFDEQHEIYPYKEA